MNDQHSKSFSRNPSVCVCVEGQPPPRNKMNTALDDVETLLREGGMLYEEWSRLRSSVCAYFCSFFSRVWDNTPSFQVCVSLHIYLSVYAFRSSFCFLHCDDFVHVHILRALIFLFVSCPVLCYVSCCECASNSCVLLCAMCFAVCVCVCFVLDVHSLSLLHVCMYIYIYIYMCVCVCFLLICIIFFGGRCFCECISTHCNDMTVC